MELRELSMPHWFTDEWALVTYQVSNAVGMCKQDCNKCQCLTRIIRRCVALWIRVPPYDTVKKYPTPIFIMNEVQLYQLRVYLLDQPEPEVW